MKKVCHEMGGAPDAQNLPAVTNGAGDTLKKVAEDFDTMAGEIDQVVKDAERAHKGRAGEAAQADIAEIVPHVKAAGNETRKLEGALEEQAGYQHEAFKAIPRQDEKLPNGEPAQIEVPEKNLAERTGFDNIPGMGWSSHYEERQRRFQATNDHMDSVTRKYQGQTDGVVHQLPKFEPPKPPPPPPPPPVDNSGTNNSGLGNSTYSSTSSLGSGNDSGSPSSTSSAWSSGSTGGGSYTPSPSPSGSQGPAGTGSAWAQGGSNSSLPPGMVKGPDGTVYRQLPDGSWQRQNPYNGRWAPAPQGPPGPPGGRGGAGGAAGGGRGQGGFGPQGSSKPGAPPLSPGGRSGVAPPGGAPSNAAASSSAAGGGQSGRGGAMRPMGGGQQGGQGGEEDEHERPNWLVETEDVWTNDMDKTAPPVIGLAPWEKEG